MIRNGPKILYQNKSPIQKLKKKKSIKALTAQFIEPKVLVYDSLYYVGF